MFKWVFSFSLLALAGVSFAAPWLGIAFNKLAYPDHLDLYVVGVHPTSGALSILEPGDTVKAMNGKVLKDETELRAILKGKKSGEKISVEFKRGSETETRKIALTERPDNLSSFTGSAIGSKALEFGENFYANKDKRKASPKATLLDFWATWCGPCRKSLPVLAKLYEDFSGRGLEVIGVSSEGQEVLDKFMKEHSSPYPQYRDSTLEMWNRYRIQSVPTLMLLDENGYILKVWHGIRSEKALREAVVEALGK